MARYQETEVAVPIVISAGGVGPMFFLFGGGVLFALIVCIAVSCTDFGDGTYPAAGDVTPAATTSSCEPFCVPAGGAR